MDKEDKMKAVPDLRKKSRRDYLDKRRQDKLLDLEQEVQEEEYYFEGQK